MGCLNLTYYYSQELDFSSEKTIENDGNGHFFVLDYFPYGKVLREYVNSGSGAEKFLTTQHERDKETGLDYRGARFYDSDVARFLSTDPLATKAPSWSPYRYCFDNPVIYVDPDGRYETKREAKKAEREAQKAGYQTDGIYGEKGNYVFNGFNESTGESSTFKFANSSSKSDNNSYSFTGQGQLPGLLQSFKDNLYTEINLGKKQGHGGLSITKGARIGFQIDSYYYEGIHWDSEKGQYDLNDLTDDHVILGGSIGIPQALGSGIGISWLKTPGGHQAIDFDITTIGILNANIQHNISTGKTEVFIGISAEFFAGFGLGMGVDGKLGFKFK